MTAQKLAALHAKCFTYPRPWTCEEFIDLLNSNTVFICDHEHGFAMGRIAGPEVELLTIAVDPNYRRLGIAQNLLEQFEATAKIQKAEEAFLEVSETNIAAIRLYQNVGFQKIGSRKGYYSNPEGARITALIMGKPL